MGYQLTGAVKVIGELQTFESGFCKREFVVTDEGKYPQDIKFECLKEKVSMLDGLSVGDAVDVDFNLNGNEYNGKYYTNLVCWKLNANSSGGSNGAAAPAEDPDEGAFDVDEGEFDVDDIPF